MFKNVISQSHYIDVIIGLNLSVNTVLPGSILVCISGTAGLFVVMLLRISTLFYDGLFHFTKIKSNHKYFLGWFISQGALLLLFTVSATQWMFFL